ncbi:MAG: glycoside hydrolase N-terminal domain-containing protein, partial [Akkermansiaceae bacterium]|nr:glycoside hydrolase N-terminal domain-containing protein [Akkermansiaceae bacterium]
MHYRTSLIPITLACAFLATASAQASTATVNGVVTSAERAHDIQGRDSLTLPAPIKRWDNALPLGNGLTGGLLWGEGRELRLSLDRGDLWDERGNEDARSPKRTFTTMLQAVQERDNGTFRKYFDSVYTGSPWTKIPGARLVMTLPEGLAAQRFHLDFQNALATVNLSGETEARAFFSATRPVALLRVPAGTDLNLIRPESINQLGYPAPRVVKTANSLSFTQKNAEDLEYTFLVQWKTIGDEILAVISTHAARNGSDTLATAMEGAGDALDQGWDAMLAPHTAWWKGFYHTSSVSVPKPRLQHHYNFVKYLYGSGSRASAPPIPLQGVWTADEGGLPPWKGDYHNDLNTQMTYVAWQTAGLEEAGMSYVNYYLDRMPQFRKHGKEFFGIEGAMVPGVMTLDGQAMGGWPQYSHSLTAGLWNGHAMYQWWKVSRDSGFLANKAYPWIKEIMESTLKLTEERDGQLFFKVSANPEWHDSSWAAFLEPNSNFDQALLNWGLAALEEMATALGKSGEAAHWAELRAKTRNLLVDEQTQALMVAKGEPFVHSHRHFSHTLAIHPLGIYHQDQGGAARETIRASVRQILDNGSQAWVGYSFTWAASLAARAGFPDEAERLLVDFERAFVTRNGFHVNGDQTGTGLSGFRYRPFTLEGNFLLMDAIHEMLMQSWGGKIRVFPAMPRSWQDASFTDLRAEGGMVVSAKRVDGKTTEVTLSCPRGGTFNLLNPFGGENEITRNLQPGESVTLTAGDH